MAASVIKDPEGFSVAHRSALIGGRRMRVEALRFIPLRSELNDDFSLICHCRTTDNRGRPA